MSSRAEQIIADALKKKPASLRRDTVKSMTGEDALLVVQKAFSAWVTDDALPIAKEFDKVKEKTEILDGSRSSKVKGKVAVRLDDLRYLAGFPSLPTARPASGTVSAAEYNALLADVRKIYDVLGSIAVIMGR